ncbi:MAG: hypothetical protein ACREIA_04460 [Opitutaceae bacterium]
MPIRETEHLLNRTRLIHLRDAAHGKLQTEFGAGEIDFEWLLDALRDRNFSGHISIEYLGANDAPFNVTDSARRLFNNVSESLTR